MSELTRGDIEVRMADMREALDIWDKAVEGDSSDAEYDAGCGLAEELRYALEYFSAELENKP